MSTELLNRISAAVNADTSTEVAVRAILDLCGEFCGINYDVDLTELLRADEARLLQWLSRLGTKFLAKKDLTVLSWLFGLEMASEDGISSLLLELEGHEWKEWDSETNDETSWSPRDSGLSLESVNKLYSINNEAAGLDYATQSCAEYTLCLGVAAALVRTAVRQSPPGWPTGRNVYVCWAGGDYVRLTV